MKPTLFLDASHLIALFDPKDEYHFAAMRFRRQAFPVVTTSLVLAEFLNAFSSSHRRIAAAEEVNLLLCHPAVQVIDFDRILLEEALGLYRSRGDKKWGLIDCASFIIMNKLRLRMALTADRDFIQAGFEALLLSS